jgi:hypothetical protein
MMKKIALLFAGTLAVLLTGCYVTSVYPFYTQKDIVSEPALVGEWVKKDESEGEIWKFAARPDNAYALTVTEKEKENVFDCRAFKLHGQLFLDLLPEHSEQAIPPHYLLKVTQVAPIFTYTILNHDWLRKLITNNPATITHHFVADGGKPEALRVVLTAGTPELQKFVVKYMNTEEAWETLEQRQRKSAATP